MKSILIIALLLSGCASFSPDAEKSISRDKTMDVMAKTALINEMLASPDSAVRLEGTRIAKDFIIPKKNIFGF
jgi:PBP1b-binding outer membrane lipoprotein LpoB